MLGELTQQEITELFERTLIGRIGCTDGERIYVVPISFLFNGDHIICHSRDGLKIEMMRKNPNVCFEIDEIHDHMHWRSVIAWGRYEELTNEHEIAKLRGQLSEKVLNRLATLTTLPPAASGDAHREKPAFADYIIYRIWITEVTGRFEKTDILIT